MYSIIGLLLLILDIYVIYLILTGSGDIGIKIVWVIVVLILPLLGPILYLLLGRETAQFKLARPELDRLAYAQRHARMTFLQSASLA